MGTRMLIALSSTKAEYKGATMAACEVAWLQKLLVDLGQSVHDAVVIYCDNISSIMLANNLAYHARTKHIDISHLLLSADIYYINLSS